jgi:hypothetical protein
LLSLPTLHYFGGDEYLFGHYASNLIVLDMSM